MYEGEDQGDVGEECLAAETELGGVAMRSMWRWTCLQVCANLVRHFGWVSGCNMHVAGGACTMQSIAQHPWVQLIK